MNLLPKDQKDFSSKEYWNEFFGKLKSEHFEWYGEYHTLCDVLDKYIHVKDKVLVVGCGNSKLSAELYDVGICNSTSIDINTQVINQMKSKYGKDRPQMVFEVMDVCELTLEDETFAVVIDKGTLDALLVDESPKTMEKIDKMFSEIDRVLRKGGRYICISLLQEHILNKILEYFLERGWFVRIHRCSKAESDREDSLTFPVFICVLTKMNKIPGAPMVLELVHESTKPKRCSSKNEVIEYIQSAQHYAFLKHYLNKKKLDDDICLELCDPVTGSVKYRMFVVDRKENARMKFALFVVPQGREIEWLFSSSEGRNELAKSASCERLIVVHLMRDIQYSSLEEVKSDLSAKVVELAPHSLNSQIPILSLGDDVGHREIRCSSASSVSGDYVVEDVLSTDDAVFRRLIFMSNPYLVQSEAKLIKTIQRKKKKIITKLEIDFDYLACDHHVAIISGLAFLENKMYCPKVLQIGLGGGTLAMYLYKHFPEAHIDVVELDPVIVDVARKWFSLADDERLNVHVADGLDFIQNCINRIKLEKRYTTPLAVSQAAALVKIRAGIKKKFPKSKLLERVSIESLQYDVVILDVDSKNPSLGISSPPVAFLENSVLTDMYNLLKDSGILLMNLACRNADLQSKTYHKLREVFKCVYSRKIPAEVNEVMYCVKSEKSIDLIVEYTKLRSFLEKQTKPSDVFNTLTLVDSLIDIT